MRSGLGFDAQRREQMEVASPEQAAPVAEMILSGTYSLRGVESQLRILPAAVEVAVQCLAQDLVFRYSEVLEAAEGPVSVLDL